MGQVQHCKQYCTVSIKVVNRLSWNAFIQLKSESSILVESLKSINVQNSSDSSITSTTDFESYHLLPSQRISFIGVNHVVTLISDSIEYVSLTRD